MIPNYHCIDNVPDSVVEPVAPIARKVRRPAEEVRNGRTCCPDCRCRILYTDWEDPDELIAVHLAAGNCTNRIVRRRAIKRLRARAPHGNRLDGELVRT